MSTTEILAFGPILVVIGAAALWLLGTRWGDVEKRTARWVSRLDRLGASWPRLALLAYRVVLRGLYRRKRESRLGPAGLETLGRAHVGACVALLGLGREEEARRHYEAAGEHLPVRSATVCRPIARRRVETGSVSPDAVETYVAYLGLPAAEGEDESLFSAVLAHLRAFCLVDEGVEPGLLERKMDANRLAATIPGPGPRLVVLSGDARGAQYPLTRLLTIGRSRHNDVVLPDKRISSTHAALIRTGSEVVLEDQGSRNGTRIGGKRVGAPVALADGAVFRIGDVDFGFYSRTTRLGAEPAWPHLNLGIGYLLAGKSDEAIQALKRSYTLDPEQPDLFWHAGRANANLGKHDLALKSFATAVKLDPCHHRARHSWAETLLASLDGASTAPGTRSRDARIRKAIGLLERACALAPSTPRYQLDLSDALSRLGRYDDALTAREKAVELDGDRAEEHLALAELARRAGNPARAKAACDAALRLEEGSLRAHRLLGDILFDEGDFAGAASHWGLAWGATETEGSHELCRSDDFRVRYGRALLETAEYKKGYRVLHTVVTRSAEALFYAGRCLAGKGALERALECYEWLLDHRGDEPEVRFHLAATLGSLGRYPAGLDAVRPLLCHEDWAPRGLYLAARLSMRAGSLDDAERFLEQAGDRGGLGREIRLERGRLALLRGSPADAARWFRASLEGTPDDAGTRLWLARALLDANDPDEAARALEPLELAELEPRTLAEVELLRGKAAYRRGAFDEAVERLELARRSGGGCDELLLLLAACHAEVGRLEDAQDAIAALASRYPGDATLEYNAAALACRMAARRLEAGEPDAAVELLERARGAFAEGGFVNEAHDVARALADACWRDGVQRLLAGHASLDEAVAALERARSLEPGSAAYRYGLGAAYFRQGRYRDAESLFRELCDEGLQDPDAWSALALSLERLGLVKDAEALWSRLIGGVAGAPPCPVGGRLGLAGLQARSGNWPRAAEILRELRDEGGEADARLGVVLALEGDADGAFPRLESAVRRGNASAALLRLFHAVARHLAARRVLDDDLEGAVELLADSGSVAGPLPRESAHLLATVESALPFQGCVGDEDAELRAYQQVYDGGRGGALALRSYAIAVERRAIAVEEEGGDADELWSLAHGLWRGIAAGRDGFWDDYESWYNARHSGPDALDRDGLTFLEQSLLPAVAEVHVELASAYASRGDRLEDVRRHVRYACGLSSSDELKKDLFERIRDAAQRSLARDHFRRSELHELLYREIDLAEARDAAVSAALEAAHDDLWDGRFPELKRDLARIADLFQGGGDLREMAQKTALASAPILEQALRLTKERLDRVDASLPERKNWMLRVVLNVGVFADSLTSLQQYVFGARLQEIILELLRQIVPAEQRDKLQGGPA